MHDRENRCGVVVCRGCCCGTVRKHPGIDHDAQLALLGEADQIQLRVVDCLGPCGASNVVVVQPSPRGRRAGGRPHWLGHVLDQPPLAHVIDWVARGGPGIADVPAEISAHTMSAPKGDFSGAPGQAPDRGR